MKNLLWLTQGRDTLPSVRFRVLPIAQEISNQNINVKIIRYPKTIGNRYVFLINSIFSKLQYDACIIQKRLLETLEISIIRNIAKKIIFDFDDAIWTNQKEASLPGSGNKWNRFQNTTSAVDLIVAGNKYLADSIKGDIPKFILPTPIDIHYYLPKNTFNPNSSPIIGWMGTSSYISGTETAIRSLRTISKNKIRLISNASPEIQLLNDVEFVRWSPENELSQLQDISIGIMPLPDDGYTRGKCGFKLLQYMSCKVVPIASAVGFNREVITHGIDGFLIENDYQWAEYAKLLIDDSELRQRMANAARNTVENRFDLRSTTTALLSHIFN